MHGSPDAGRFAAFLARARRRSQTVAALRGAAVGFALAAVLPPAGAHPGATPPPPALHAPPSPASAANPAAGKREKEITMAIAKAWQREMLKSGRVRVALTRDTDKFLVLQDRYEIARKMNADLFVSIHADSAESQDASGGTVYTLSEVASDREAQRLAARENKANIINGVNLGGADANVSSILIDLTQRETMNVSADFAKLLLREAKPNMRMRSNSHRFASFLVQRAPDHPPIQLQTGDSSIAA